MKFFIVDGSDDCFYTAVFDAYREKECLITSAKNLQLNLDSLIIEIRTDKEKSDRVKSKLSATDPLAPEEIHLILRSCDSLKEQVAFEYIKLIMQYNRPVRTITAHPAVMEMYDAHRKVTGEIHRLKGLLRFMESAQGVLYAPYSPDNDVTDILAVHFAERFNNQRFVIHDIKRKTAALYDGLELIVTDVGEEAEICLSEYEKYFEDLWKLYYKSVNIDSRPHERQMKGSMPVRYWKFLPEKR